jgi:hypothetical protein
VNGQTFVLHNPVQDGAVEADKQKPYILDHVVLVGSAVAVAANLCVVAVGTEDRWFCGLSFCSSGIVGIKPTID